MKQLAAALRPLLPALAGGLTLACVSTEVQAPVRPGDGGPRAEVAAAPDLTAAPRRDEAELLRAVLEAARDRLGPRPSEVGGVGPLESESALHGRGTPAAAALAARAGVPPETARRGRALPVPSDRPLTLDQIARAMGADVPLGQALALTTRSLYLERRAADGGWETVATWHNQPGVSLPRGLAEFARKLEWLVVERGLALERVPRAGMHRAWEDDRRAVLRIDPGAARVPLRLWPDGVDLEAVPLGAGVEATVAFGSDVGEADRATPFRYRFVPRSERQVVEFLGTLSRNQLSAADLGGPAAATPYVPWFSDRGTRLAAFRLRGEPTRADGPSIGARFAGREVYVAGGGSPADRTLASLRFVETLLAPTDDAVPGTALAAR